jgi:pterin-4a-carbinolamine dehydratase
VILDDWSVSGAQVGDIYANLSHQPKFEKYKDRIEVNNLVASAERIEHGLETKLNYVPVKLPVKAYYKAHDADARDTNARITGTHSSVDYGFKYSLEYATRKIYNPSEDDSLKAEVPYVPLANVVRAYRNTAPHITLSPEGVIRRLSR